MTSRTLIQSKELEQILQHSVYWTVDWHKDLPFVVFVGQRKDQTDSESTDTKERCSLKDLENEFKYKNTFGERLNDFHSPEIFLFDYEKNQLHLLGHQFPNLDPSVVIFAQNPDNLNLFMQAFDQEPFKRGLLYCFNRSSRIFSLEIPLPQAQAEPVKTDSNEVGDTSTLSVQKMETLTPDFFCSYSPMLSPSGDFLFFAASPDKFIQHNSNFELFYISTKAPSKKPVKLVSKISKPNPKFVGLDYNLFANSERFFLHNGKFLLFTAHLGNSVHVFLMKMPTNSDQPFPGKLLWLIQRNQRLNLGKGSNRQFKSATQVARRGIFVFIL